MPSPLRAFLTARPDVYTAKCVYCMRPATSPMAHTLGAVVRRVSSIWMPRSGSPSIPPASRPISTTSCARRPGHSGDAGRPAVGKALHAYRLSARADVDAFLAQDHFQCPRDLFIFPRQEPITAPQHRHRHAEPVEDLP